jgi:rhodanese-related sulfurtransferase
MAGAHPDSGISEIDFSELRTRLDDPSLVILDVLPRESYASAHIAGAVNLPMSELAGRAAQLLPWRDREIAVYCASPT